MSSIPWRKVGIKYTSNEIYLDIIEEVDAIVERYSQNLVRSLLSPNNPHPFIPPPPSNVPNSNGNIVSSEIQGRIMVNCKLSGSSITFFFSFLFFSTYPSHSSQGMPDLTLVFGNPRILEDVRFHPCVR